MKYEKILVVSPSNLITGGPEALHHLVDEMRKVGLPAHICYYPFDEIHNVPSAYSLYDVSPTYYVDSENYLIVFPETFTEQLGAVKKAKTAIWWLSLDNFLVRNQRPNDTIVRSYIRYIRLAIKGARPLLGVYGLKNSLHLSQSRYVQRYLSKHSIPSDLLLEPINTNFLSIDRALSTTRTDVILYNPAKGIKFTQKLIDAYPQYTFLPLKGYSRSELLEKMKASKIYIDFGHHPGRDRMPREAAMLGLVVITSRDGSAGINEDVPLPDLFKIDTASPDFVNQVGLLLAQVFNNFDATVKLLDSYRNHILNEPAIFNNCIREIFSS